VHVLAAVVQSLWLHENLPLSMITGRRCAPPPPPAQDGR
jgi:hypothetical protein